MDTMASATIILVLMSVGIHADSELLAGYIPHITPQNLEGKITASTFVLAQPRCYVEVHDVEVLKGPYRIWLLVARSDALGQALPEDPPNLPYQSFSNKSYYMTLGNDPVNYPCKSSPDEITVLRVGADTSCINDSSKPNCNGPLPDRGPYKVRFIATKNGNVTAQSQWSDEITLIQGRDYTTINARPRRLSAGTIAIIAILSILFAILLASFIAALIYTRSGICGNGGNISVQDSVSVTRYTTHHVYNQASAKS